MQRTDVVVIGGGQAGLAMSRCLWDRGIAHVVLERGRVAERWRSERWDSLTLLTPSWQSRLPGWRYQGPDPDGYMSAAELVRHLDAYARSFPAPVESETTVRAVERAGDGFRVATDRGAWAARSVVIATGHCDLPQVPACADALAPSIDRTVPTRYRNPAGLAPGGVLVVGASASGVQLADELRRAGREVTLAVGRHTRLPRRYRGRDVLWWLDRLGVFDETTEDVPDLEAALAQPSLQLVGRPETLDLAVLRARGVRLAGRLTGVDGTRVRFAGDLAATTAHADCKLERLLARIDRHIEARGLAPAAGPAERPAPIALGDGPDALDLRDAGITTVVWATGFRRSYPWLKVPVLDERGEISHRGGVTPAPGLYVLGLRLQRTRKSSFLDGVDADAAALADHIDRRLARPRAAA